MTANASDSQILIVASDAELAASRRIWGTGGWQPPEAREALDWLTFSILSGWRASVVSACDPSLHRTFGGGARRVIIACDPDQLGDQLMDQILARLRTEGVLVVARAGAAGGKWARLAGATQWAETTHGRSLCWTAAGPVKIWHCRKDFEFRPLCLEADTAVWAKLESAPIIAARQAGCGALITLGLHPSHARDCEGSMTNLLRQLLVSGIGTPLASLDWRGTMVLRMDDPGCSQNVYLRSWRHGNLDEADWEKIGRSLEQHNARLSIGYVSGWVDDGAPQRGQLLLSGVPADREGGRVHPSPLVRYRQAQGLIHDCEAEYRGIQRLRARGLCDVELHGYTHLHPDRAAWLAAPDRYESPSWFRELGRAAETILARLPLREHPLAQGMETIQKYFGATPSTLICPGEDFTDPAIETALDLGLQLVGSYYLALRHQDRFCWTQHVCAPYLDQPDPAWFDSGLPCIGYFHDRDLAIEGIEWFGDCLKRWTEAGAVRFVGYRDLAAALVRDDEIERPLSAQAVGGADGS